MSSSSDWSKDISTSSLAERGEVEVVAVVVNTLSPPEPRDEPTFLNTMHFYKANLNGLQNYTEYLKQNHGSSISFT